MNEEPIVRVETKSGMIYYPKFEKDTEGKWRPVDLSFQKMNRLRYNSEMRVNKDK